MVFMVSRKKLATAVENMVSAPEMMRSGMANLVVATEMGMLSLRGSSAAVAGASVVIIISATAADGRRRRRVVAKTEAARRCLQP